MPLLIYHISEAIQYAWTILDFTILAQYVLYDEETLCYIEHTLYRFEKTKIAFEQHWHIDSKLCQPIFNYLKFHAINHFVQSIRDYNSAVNYDTAYSETAHKYFLKTFYNKINKKKYKSQIWHHNMHYTNIITMKDVIILQKAREKKNCQKVLQIQLYWQKWLKHLVLLILLRDINRQ